MMYSDFTLPAAAEQFGFQVETAPLFRPPDFAPVGVPPLLQTMLTLGEGVSLTTSKARSEFIVAPLLLAARDLAGENKINLFSGEPLDVSPSEGLCGICDFVLCASKPMPLIHAPVVSIVQAPQGDLELGWGRCAAQMVAILRFNERGKTPRRTIYGCVTTGRVWQFMRLCDSVLTFDTPILQLVQKELILATFFAMLK